MNWDNIIEGLIGAGGGTIIGFVAGRRKENAEVKGTELDNIEKAVKMWREMAEELKGQVEDLSQKVDTLMAEVHDLRAENAELRTKIGGKKKPQPTEDPQ